MALPTRADLRSPRRLLQVACGFVCFFLYAAGAVAAGGFFGRELNVLPGVAAVLVPLPLIAAFVWLFDAKAFGRGFVLGVVAAVVVSTAVSLIRLLR